MTTEITTFTPEQKSLLLETRCKGVRTEDFMFMLELAKKYQLDPFAGQIYCTKVGIIISRDGYLAFAHRSGQFDGIRTEFQHDENGNPIVATTTVWRKDISHPFVESAYWSDYNKGTDVWKQYKHAMLQKVSERMALTKAFCITGLYSDAELGDGSTPAPVRIVDEDCIDIEPQPAKEQPKPEPVKQEPAPVPEKPKAKPKAKPTCNTVTIEEVNCRYIPIYQEQKLNLAIFADADLGDGKYNLDMINEDYKKQKGLLESQPEVHTESGLDEFKKEIIQEATSKQTKPSATLTEKTCEKCGCKLIEADLRMSKDFCEGHLFCEKHGLEYVANKSKQPKN